MEVKHFWGSLRVTAQRYEHKDGRHCQIALDPGLDESGWTAGALNVMMRLSGSMSFEKAEEIVRDFHLLPNMSRAGLERLTQPYALACQREIRELLDMAQTASLSQAGQGRTMILEVDGVRVLGQAEQGLCEGIEIKSAVLYPMNDPDKRSMIADVCETQDFTSQLAGLLREAGVRNKDELIGVSDGAVWIKHLYDTLGIEQIIDVYHSSCYLDTLMTSLDWSEEQRTQTRRTWLKGELNAGDWLSQHEVNLQQVSLDEPSQTALAYLKERQHCMNYVTYKVRSLPIGSGQVEGMNKSVIGYRMKQSGMQWSRSGAGRMAALRARRCSKSQLVSHDTIRFAAFSCPVG